MTASLSDETRRALQAAGMSAAPDPAVGKILADIRRREAGVLGGRASHEEYLRTCGAIEGLRFTLKALGQEER